jgi:SOS-response transcriptional repressor LexA
MEVIDLIRKLAEDMKQGPLARALGVKQPSVSRWLNGSQPQGHTRDKIVALATERGLINVRQPRRAPATRFVSVPLLSWVSAGRLLDASTQVPEAEAPKLAFADLGAGDFFALKVDGDSMDRISPDGSIIVVDRRDTTLTSGRAYVFAHLGEATYKLWHPKPPRLAPFSTNPRHEPIFLDRRRDMEVIGRVRRSVIDL